VLCDPRPESERPGPTAYQADHQSAGRLNFPYNPEGAKQTGRFGRAAMLGQPLDYAQAVGNDMLRYVWHDIGFHGPAAGIPAYAVSFGYRDQGTEAIVEQSMTPRYQGVHMTTTHARAVGDYQQIVRVHGPLIALLFILTIAAAILLRGPLRLATATFATGAFMLYLAPALTFTYDFRYGIPPGLMMAIAGTLAVYGLWERYGANRASGKT
jgi:hypothetical protein